METGNAAITNLLSMRGPMRTDCMKRPRRPQHASSRTKHGAGDGIKPVQDNGEAGAVGTIKPLQDGGDGQVSGQQVSLHSDRELSVIERHCLKGQEVMMAKLKNSHVTPCLSTSSDISLCKLLEHNEPQLEAKARTVGIENGTASQQNPWRCGDLGSSGIINSAARLQKLLSQKMQRQGNCEPSLHSNSTCLSGMTPNESADIPGPEIESPPSAPTSSCSSTKPYQISPVRSPWPGNVLDLHPELSTPSPISDLEARRGQSGILSTLSATGSDLESTDETSSARGSEWESTDETSVAKGPERESIKETLPAVGEERESGRDTSFSATQETGRRRALVSKMATLQCQQSSATERCEDHMYGTTFQESAPTPGTSQQEPLLTSGTSSQEPLSTSEPSQEELSGSARQPSSGVNYVKLWVSDGKEGQGYALTLVASDMSKLMDISSLLTSNREAAVVNFGTSSEALVDEVSEQIGMPLTMVKLHTLPRGGRYSAQKLVELSASRLSHQKPHDWYRIVDKFERENMGFILLKGEDVRYFEPSDWRMPEGRGFMTTEAGRARSKLIPPQEQSQSDLRRGEDGQDLVPERNDTGVERRQRSLDSGAMRVFGGFGRPPDCGHTQKAVL